MIVPRSGGVWVRLTPDEVALLQRMPLWLDRVGEDPDDPAGPRLHQSAYPEDPLASAEYEVAYGPQVDELRTEDRDTFGETLRAATAGTLLTEAQAASWMRVVGDARLTLAARLGIEDNTWETAEPADPRMHLVHYLTGLQSALIDALDTLLEA